MTSPARRLAMIVALAGIPLLTYANSFSTDFALDNKALILQDARVHAATRENVSLILTHSYWWPIGESGLYRRVRDRAEARLLRDGGGDRNPSARGP
jgi:hypothetical protein